MYPNVKKQWQNILVVILPAQGVAQGGQCLRDLYILMPGSLASLQAALIKGCS